jgi:hypothetical protein
VPMPPSREQSDSDASASRNRNAIDPKIAELMAAPPLVMDELFGDATVRMRVGMLIAHAMDTPPTSQHGNKLR